MDKIPLIQAIQAQLEAELALILQAANAAHQGATHEENKAENKYDTRALESAYLAGAQAKRAAQIQETILYFKLLKPKSFDATTPIALTAFVELESDGKKSAFFLADQGGGLSIRHEGRTVLVVGSQSPLAENLLGCKLGDVFEVPTKNGIKEYEVVFVS